MLTNKQRSLYESYKYNNREHLLNDVRTLQQNLRYRNIDVVDCLELALAIERLNQFENVCKSVDHILSLDKFSNIAVDPDDNIS